MVFETLDPPHWKTFVQGQSPNPPTIFSNEPNFLEAWHEGSLLGFDQA
jgi:hypothetical protein